jgi:hypothetical protein
VAWLLAPVWVTPAQMNERSLALAQSLQATFGSALGAGLEGAVLAVREAARDGSVDRALDQAWHGPQGRQLAARSFAQVGQWLAETSDLYLVGLRGQMQGAWLRAATLATWLVLLAPLLLAALADGACARRIDMARLRQPEPTRYAIARHAVGVMCLVPLAYLAWPFAFDSSFMPWWALVLAAALRSMVRHMQPSVSRPTP